MLCGSTIAEVIAARWRTGRNLNSLACHPAYGRNRSFISHFPSSVRAHVPNRVICNSYTRRRLDDFRFRSHYGRIMTLSARSDIGRVRYAMFRQSNDAAARA
jgi:hypothetical protein